MRVRAKRGRQDDNRRPTSTTDLTLSEVRAKKGRRPTTDADD
jgi:hypothetical protein